MPPSPTGHWEWLNPLGYTPVFRPLSHFSNGRADALGAGAEGGTTGQFGQDSVGVADPGAQQWSAVAGIDQVLDAEPLGRSERRADLGQAAANPLDLRRRVL